MTIEKNIEHGHDYSKSQLFSQNVTVLRYFNANGRRKPDLFTVDQSTVIIELGIESGPIRRKPRVDRFQHARGDEREEPDCHGEYAFGT